MDNLNTYQIINFTDNSVKDISLQAEEFIEEDGIYSFYLDARLIASFSINHFAVVNKQYLITRDAF